jgi:hypothetical protein
VSPSVYYRVYSLTSGVEVKNPEFPEDPYLGRALAIRIPPPHLAASLKRHICGREDIADYEHASLFPDISCLTPLDDSEAVHILDRAGTGSTPGDPVALVSSKLGVSERTHVPDGARYQYKLKAYLDCKVNGPTSGRFLMCFVQTMRPIRDGYPSRKATFFIPMVSPLKVKPATSNQRSATQTLIPFLFRPISLHLR